jgi:hypothetical protein
MGLTVAPAPVCAYMVPYTKELADSEHMRPPGTPRQKTSCSVMMVNTMSVETTGAPCLPAPEVGPVRALRTKRCKNLRT